MIVGVAGVGRCGVASQSGVLGHSRIGISQTPEKEVNTHHVVTRLNE